jgi:hypothetical protein
VSDKNFKVKNGADVGGTVTATAFVGDGSSLTGVSSYNAPTLGSTSIASGATVTEVTGLSLASPTIKYPVTSASVTDTIYYASTQYLADFPSTGNEEGIRYMTAAGDNRFVVGDVVSVTGMNIGAANVTNKTIVSVSGQEITVFVGTGNVLARNVNAYNAAGQDPTMTKAGVTTQSPGTSGQVLKSTGTGVEWSALSVNDGTTTTAANGLGFMGIPQNSTTTGAYAVLAADAGKHIYSTATRTITIPANASVALPVGTTITFVAGVGATVTIAITTDTMYLAGPGTTGSRTLAAFGMATAVKIAATTWIISGNGLT